MTQQRVGDYVQGIRSKNAGPFWVTIDLFCGSDNNFSKLCNDLQSMQVANALQVEIDQLKRFEIASLNVIKFSLPRPVVQGHRTDRDMHGAQWAVLIEELPIPPSQKTPA